ncbi:MAG: hypothetical protein IH860_08735 [Chloroflexi bacterium]|nr:hypothetical protein [Chloroflexota bacterium]
MAAVERDFRVPRTRLKRLEKVYNPHDDNLHFTPLARADAELYSALLDLAQVGLKTVRQHGDYFLRNALYDDGMFWYDLLLLIKSAGVQVVNTRTQSSISGDTVERLVDALVDISNFTLSGGGGDMEKRNYEALGNTLWAFHSEELVKIARKRAAVVGSQEVMEFVDGAIKAAEDLFRE